MQADGNFVLYNDANQAAWASGSWGSGRVNPFLEMQNDGNLVVYHNGRSPLWTSAPPDSGGPGHEDRHRPVTEPGVIRAGFAVLHSPSTPLESALSARDSILARGGATRGTRRSQG
jgi:hypothetical protein